MDRFDAATERWDFKERADVIGAEGDKVGEIVAVESGYIVVQKGFFFPTDYYIPVSAIKHYDGDKVYLSVTKDEALNQGWDTQPAGDMVGDDPGYLAGAGANASSASMGGYADANAGYTAQDAGYVAADATSRTNHAGGTVSEMNTDTMRVPVHEEDLVATKRAREAGEVTITKDVVTEERTISVPVTEERVRVNWRVPDDAASADANAFQEGSIEIPVRTEEVVVDKVVRKTGELEVEKQAVQHTEQVADTVRRERVRVDDATGHHIVADSDLTEGGANR